nr:hypothetical protein [Tanacetum cinerariifolium]
MAARGGRNNLVARRAIDDLIVITRERSPLKYLKIFIEQQITDHSSGDYEEVFDLVMELRDDRRDEQDKVDDFNRLIAVAEEKIRGKEIDLEMLEAKAFALVCEAPMCLIRIAVGNAVFGFWHVYSKVLLHRLSFGRINWFSDYMDEYNHDDENNHSNGNVVKRGITRLYKFRREYEKPDGIKLSVTFDALNSISGKHRALFSSFLGDMVREHIGVPDQRPP